MNKQKFIELLREPSSISRDELSGLENVTRQYPYFQSAHLLLAKGSRLRKDPNTKKRISSAAVYCTDRVLLKKYISGDMIFLDSVNKPPINVEEELPDKKAKSTLKQQVRVKRQLPPDVKKSKPRNPLSGSKSIPAIDDSNFNPDSILDEIKSGLESYKANKKHFEDYIQSDEEEKAVEDALSKATVSDSAVVENDDEVPVQENQSDEFVEEPTLEEIVNSEVEKEVDTLENPADEEIEFDISGIIEEIKNDEAIEKENNTKAESKNSEKENKPTDTVSPKKEIESKQEKAEKPKEQPIAESYSNKIIISGSNKSKAKEIENPESEATPKAKALVSDIPPDNYSEDTVEVEKTAISDQIEESESIDESTDDSSINRDDQKSDDEDDNLSAGALRKAKMKRLKMQKEIIEDFIDTTPQMPNPRDKAKSAESEAPKDLSEKSQQPIGEIVSENMAIIYKNQGKLEKAVDIYNKLILKFPEKEAYFAARIKELK